MQTKGGKRVVGAQWAQQRLALATLEDIFVVGVAALAPWEGRWTRWYEPGYEVE